MRGTSVYRIALILPYAMPAFAMLLVWRDMFNRDFGLINQLFGLDVDWFGAAVDRPARGHPGAALAGLPVHVPGDHRRAAGHPDAS